MLKQIYNALKWRLERRWTLYQIRNIDNISDLEIYAEKHKSYLKNYIEHGKKVITSFKHLVDKFQLNLDGLSVLDIGPGAGPFIEVAKIEGACNIEFVDYDPIFVRYLELKGYKGYLINYMNPNGFKSMLKNRYDFILSKGSIHGDRFNALIKNPNKRRISLDKWLTQVETMLNPGGQIIITPTYGTAEDGYKCSDLKEFRNSGFVLTMLKHKYKVYPIIKGYTSREGKFGFPFTFYKQVEK
jgi:hypothetical protein